MGIVSHEVRRVRKKLFRGSYGGFILRRERGQGSFLPLFEGSQRGSSGFACENQKSAV